MVSFDNKDLQEQFRVYLETTSADSQKPASRLDLFSFYSELIALKNEVKIESRQLKQGLDDFRESSGQIEQINQGMASLLKQGHENSPQDNVKSLPDPVVGGLLDLYDRVKSSLQTVPDKPSFWSRLCKSKEIVVIKAMRDGQHMIMERTVDLLSECGISVMEVLNKKFDPHVMRAVGVNCSTDLADGVVSAEIQTGFMASGNVLRMADVLVNRLKK